MITIASVPVKTRVPLTAWGNLRAADACLLGIDADAHCTWFHGGRSACGGNQPPGEHELGDSFPLACSAAASAA